MHHPSLALKTTTTLLFVIILCPFNKKKQAKTTIQNRHCCFSSHALALVGGGACWAAGAGAVRHEAGKLRKVYLSVAVQVGLRNHGLDLGLRKRLTEVVHRQSELLLRDEAVAVAIEDLQRGGSFSCEN